MRLRDIYFIQEWVEHMKFQYVELKRNPYVLTFRNRASYIYDGHTANLQMLHFIYLFNKYTY